MTETEWRAYLRREIERLLEAAGERELRLTLKFLRTAAAKHRKNARKDKQTHAKQSGSGNQS